MNESQSLTTKPFDVLQAECDVDEDLRRVVEVMRDVCKRFCRNTHTGSRTKLLEFIRALPKYTKSGYGGISGVPIQRHQRGNRTKSSFQSVREASREKLHV